MAIETLSWGNSLPLTITAGQPTPNNLIRAALAAAGERPSISNTGLTDPEILTPSGSLTVNSGGSVGDHVIYENLDLSGTLTINAEYVTFRNCKLHSGAKSAFYTARVLQSTAADRVIFEDCEIYSGYSACLYGRGFTARRCYIHDSGGDGIVPYVNVRVESCFITHLASNDYVLDGSNPHADAIMIDGSAASHNIQIVDNYLDIPIGQPGIQSSNAAVFIKSTAGAIDDILIDGNWLNGGNYTIFVRNGDNGNPTNVVITDNRFGRDYRYGLYSLQGTVTVSGNVWDDTGESADENP